jgi:RNA polymerase sigma-70 factor (ECF subfamily)
MADERTSVPEIAEVSAEAISFEEFFEEHHGRLFSALCAATANRQEAEEVMQEAFLKLWERWDRVSSLEDPVGYLYRTAMNVFRKRLRRAKLAVRKAVGRADAADAYDVIDARAVVIQGLRELRPNERAAVVLTSLRGFSSEEAADMLGMKAATVRALASRGRARMRKVVES